MGKKNEFIDPPQLSTFARSSSEFSDDETPKGVKKEEKPSTEVMTRSEPSEPKKDNNEEEDDDEEDGGTAFGNFFQLLQALSGGGVRVQPSSDDGDGIQCLLARLVIVIRKYHLFRSFDFLELNI
jgi:hypothetical protein